MKHQASKNDMIYTYQDYLEFPESERWEIINGIAYMQAAPSRIHQAISISLASQIYNFIHDKLNNNCEVYSAPFCVRFPLADEDDKDIIDTAEPDIVVICDDSKLDDKGCRGAPDFIIEILSPSSASMDHVKKLNMYEKNGVKEYWIVDPINKLVFIRRIGKDGRYGVPIISDEKYCLEVNIINGLFLNLDVMFEFEE